MKRRLSHFLQRAASFRRLLSESLANQSMKAHRLFNRVAKSLLSAVALLFLGIAVVLRPIMGGLPINGAQVLLRLNDSSGIIDIAYQKDVSFDTSNALIDISNKTSGRRSLYLMGRLDEEVSLDMFWSDETSYIRIRNAARNGIAVIIVRAYDEQADGTYANIEQASAVITKLGEKFPDQEGGMVNVSMKISGDWGAVV